MSVDQRTTTSIPKPRAGDSALKEPAAAPGTAWCRYLAVALFLLYALGSVRNHVRLGTHAYDLGIFDDAVASYAHGHLPVSDLRGPGWPLLADHFSPILAVLAPLYRVFPSPVTLLVAQAALFAVAVVPIGTWAQQVLGRNRAVVIALGYGLSWGIAQAVEFDFHEIAFAVPLLAFSICALGQGRAAAAVCWAAPLVLVKEDLGLTVAVLGLLVWRCCGRRRLGLLTALGGVVGTGVGLLVIKAANPGGAYALGHTLSAGHASGPGGLLEQATVGLVTPEPKAILLILLLAPTAFMALRSPFVLLTIPTLGWRLLPDWWPYFQGHYHYNATLMAILFVAMIDGLRRCSGPAAEPQHRNAVRVCALVTAILLPANFLWAQLKPSTWRPEQRTADAATVMALIPDGANVAASNDLAPHLTGRAKVSVYGWTDSRSNPNWIVVDQTSWPWPFGTWDKQQAALAAARHSGFQDVAQRGDFLLLHR